MSGRGKPGTGPGILFSGSGRSKPSGLPGVVRPETFRHTCLEARRGYLGAEEALAQ